MESIQFLWQKVTVLLNGFSVAPTYIQAGALIILVFLLIISLAQFRQHFVKWSMKGGLVGLFFGFLLTILLEGFLLLSGHTFLTSILGWNNPPKPFSTALDLGKQKLTNVLGVTTQNPTAGDTIILMQSLPPSEISKIKAIICTP
jgi:hypothetical protein